MKFFIDTADVKEIREAAAMGLVDGVTTNPSLVAKTGRKFRDVLLEICDLVKGPVSAEVVGTQHDAIMAAHQPHIAGGERRGMALGIFASGNYLAGTLWPPVVASDYSLAIWGLGNMALRMSSASAS